MKCFYALIFLFLTGNMLLAQVDRDTIPNLPDFRHRPLISGLEGLISNIVVNRYNAVYRDLDWAKVTPKNWYENLHSGFKSDGDAFGTNFFGHPYQGSLYFNAARSQGSSFWGSIPYVLVGSWTWEFFGETEAPSEIDWNTTTFGGIFIGEITHRLSLQLLRSSKSRKYKWLRNTGATLINPLLQLNSLCFQDVKYKSRSDRHKDFPIRSQLTGGISHLLLPNKKFLSRNYFHINYSLIYGDLFDNSRKYKPFDFFVFRSWLDLSTFGTLKQNYLSMTSHAPLWRLYNNGVGSFSISNHYDFMHNPIFKIGAISLSADYYFRPDLSNIELMAAIKAGPIIFGSSKSEVIEKYGDLLSNDVGYRDYVYGKGLMFEFEMLLKTKKFGKIISNLNYWGIVIQRDTPGSEQNGVFKVEYYYPIFNNFGVGIEYFGYKRLAKYDDFEEFSLIKDGYSEVKLLSYLVF